MHTTLSKKDFSRYLPFLLLVMTVFRVLAGLRIPYMILANQRYDDRLLFENAYDLLSGVWLGSYDSYTLAKGIGYPLFLVLAKKLVQTIRSMKNSLNIAHFFIFLTIACGGLSKVLDRTTSTLKEEFGIQLVPHTQIMIMTIEEGVEMLLPVLLIVAVLSYRKVLNQAQ